MLREATRQTSLAAADGGNEASIERGGFESRQATDGTCYRAPSNKSSSPFSYYRCA
jgi:hypothetical protein